MSDQVVAKLDEMLRVIAADGRAQTDVAVSIGRLDERVASLAQRLGKIDEDLGVVRKNVHALRDDLQGHADIDERVSKLEQWRVQLPELVPIRSELAVLSGVVKSVKEKDDDRVEYWKGVKAPAAWLGGLFAFVVLGLPIYDFLERHGWLPWQ